MKKKNVILLIQPLHLIIIPLIALCVFIFFLFLPNIFGWERDEWRIIWYIISGSGVLFFFFQFLKNMQFAVMKGENIILKKYIWITIAEIAPENIRCITMEALPAQPNPRSPIMEWITIYTGQDGYRKHKKYGGINVGRNSYWQMIASKRNKDEILSRKTLAQLWINGK